MVFGASSLPEPRNKQQLSPHSTSGPAQELLEASRESPDGVIRLAALQAVQSAPETALSFGLYEKRDIVDVLSVAKRAEHAER